MKRLCLLSGVAAVLPAIFLSAANGAERGQWQTDYDKARQEATAKRKDLLIHFSGMDWCELCRRLDREVFRKEEFLKSASRPFVLVRIDSPIDLEIKARIPEHLAVRHNALREEYSVKDYPAVFLATADGKPYARTGYRPGGANAYLKHLDSLLEKKRKRNALLAETKNPSCQGLELARALDEIITNTHPDLAARYHREDMQRIVTLDADNTAGLRQKYRARLLSMDAADAMASCRFTEAVKLYDSMIAELEPTGEMLQDILLIKERAYSYLRDRDGVRDSLNRALAAAPDSKKAPGIKTSLRRQFPDSKPAASSVAP